MALGRPHPSPPTPSPRYSEEGGEALLPTRALLLVLLAVVCAGLNALKPLHIDNAPAYVYLSRQHIEHPHDPYGFDINWYYEPQPALEVLFASHHCSAPWAAARALFRANGRGHGSGRCCRGACCWLGALCCVVQRFAPGILCR